MPIGSAPARMRIRRRRTSHAMTQPQLILRGVKINGQLQVRLGRLGVEWIYADSPARRVRQSGVLEASLFKLQVGDRLLGNRVRRLLGGRVGFAVKVHQAIALLSSLLPPGPGQLHRQRRLGLGLGDLHTDSLGLIDQPEDRITRSHLGALRSGDRGKWPLPN